MHRRAWPEAGRDVWVHVWKVLEPEVAAQCVGGREVMEEVRDQKEMAKGTQARAWGARMLLRCEGE